MRTIDASFTDFLAVNVQCGRAGFAQAAAVVGEFHPHLMFALRKSVARYGIETAQAKKVIVVLEFCLVNIDGPTAHVTTLSNDNPVAAGLGHFDLGSNRVRLVID